MTIASHTIGPSSTRKVRTPPLIASLTVLFAVLTALAPLSLTSQEALLSTAENYYEFLALDGYAERPTLNYRTLSDSVWTVNDESGNLWSGVNLGSTRSLTDSVSFRVYGPELFSSYNSASPYGQNDGALWQGKGLNSSLTGGARVEAYGFEITLKPELAFSQNQAFDLVPPAYSGALYTGKADTYGYYAVSSIDAPQRFGSDPFFAFSWGDSEIRYTWKNLTAGFGTQSIWLGPARINPILHSNNAAPYPKADIGLRRQRVTLFGKYVGDIEGRLWCGYLSESEYFDTDETNDHNMISGLSIAYAPPILDGLTLFANRVYLAKWKKNSIKTVPSLFSVSLSASGAQDVWDQRASIGFDYLFAKAGAEVYGEAGINDYGPSIDGYIRYPFHTMVYTAGLVKTIHLPTSRPLGLEIIFEWSNLEISQDYQFLGACTFYSHGQITQGYTNGGQWLGAGNGTGGNSQYLGFKLYYPKGYTNLYFHRQNPDNDYIYALSVGTGVNPPASMEGIEDFKAILAVGCDSLYNLSNHLSVKGGLACIIEHNPVYESNDWDTTNKRLGFRLESAISWQF